MSCVSFLVGARVLDVKNPLCIDPIEVLVSTDDSPCAVLVYPCHFVMASDPPSCVVPAHYVVLNVDGIWVGVRRILAKDCMT
jgi:hypothetical protein